MFAVFNAGPAPVHLARGDGCFLVWYAGLLAKIKDSKEDADERLRKIERDHAILKWAIGIVAAVIATWFGREFLPARAPSPVAPPALSGPSIPGAQVPR